MESTNKTIYIVGEVDDNMTLDVLKELSEDSGEDFTSLESLTVDVSSPGGSIHACFAIIDLIQEFAEKHNVTIKTIGHGQISSAGFFIFIAGNIRELKKHCRVFVHEHISPIPEVPYTQIVRYLREDQRLYNMYCTYVEDQLGISKKSAKALLNKDGWLSDSEISKYNITKD